MRGANAADQIVAQQLHGATGKGGLRSCEVIALNREDIQLRSCRSESGVKAEGFVCYHSIPIP